MIVTADQFRISLNWSGDSNLVAGRIYCIPLDDRFIPFKVTAIKHRKPGEANEFLSAKRIPKHTSGFLNISFDEAVTVKLGEHYDVVDAKSHECLGSCFFEFVLYRASNLRWQELSIDKIARAEKKNQKPLCIWFTGLSGSGKSTIANALERRLYDIGMHTYLLDGDNLRFGLNRDLGFTEADRVENIRRVGEVARLMVDAGLIVLASFISPYASDRMMVRNLFSLHEFIEVFVDTPLSECERRDVKGLYAKARRGEIKNFTGIDSAYERPESAELVLDTSATPLEDCVNYIFEHLQSLQSK